MKRFSTALVAALAAHNSNASTLADALGLAASSVTRVVKGQRVATNGLAGSICRHFRARPDIAYELMVAHLLDVAESFGIDITRLTIAHGDSPVLSVSPRMAALLTTLGAEALHEPTLAAVIEDLSRLAESHRARLAAGQIYPFTPADNDHRVAEELKIAASKKPENGKRQ